MAEILPAVLTVASNVILSSISVAIGVFVAVRFQDWWDHR